MTDDVSKETELRMTAKLLGHGGRESSVMVETRRSRLQSGPKKPPRIEIAPAVLQGEACWQTFLVGNGHRVTLGVEWELATVQAKARTMETMGMKVEWVRA